jgi:hypothetical protein
MFEIHNHGKRMPVILEKADWPVWLGEIEADMGDVTALRGASDYRRAAGGDQQMVRTGIIYGHNPDTG